MQPVKTVRDASGSPRDILKESSRSDFDGFRLITFMKILFEKDL